MKVNNNGDSQWIVDALDLYESPLLRYATWMLRNPEWARDIVQEAFLRLCREDPAKLAGHVAPWLFTVCRNLAFDARKKEPLMTPLEDCEIGVDSHLDRKETAEEIFRLVQHLPGNQREVVYLKFQCDLSYKEISAVTRLSVSNVGFLLHTALKEIRQQILSESSRRIR